ncbi:nucleoside phosphatase family-domain-containing protein [Cyathus striatus]|nr:nucleoside phosphatase family-domain-containing protein [Cyathus striatus]
MPPPTVVDPWLAGRHFGIVIDAGSSGSRLQIYSWKDPRSITAEHGSALASSLPKVEKGTQDDESWVAKVEPGISSFTDNPQDVGTYLRPLLAHAREHVPPSLQHETPIFLLATAGMRLLNSEQQAQILDETCHFLDRHSNFKIDSPSEVGPCGSSVRIITGEEEGLFGWIAVNYLMNGFTGSSEDRTTYGFLDMGGASTQIAFEPSPDHRGDENNLIDVRLRLLGGEEIHHKVFVTTCRERYVGKAITEFEDTRSGLSDIVPDPCLPKGLVLTESPIYPTARTGSFERCLKKTSSLLNKNKPCPDTPCLMDGVHVPPIDFSVSHFIGVSEYWYSSEHIFGLGGPYDFQHEESSTHHHLGGDGEIMENGRIVNTGVWGPKVEISRLQMQCFKAAWIVNVLHEGLKMPRIVDSEGMCRKKGLGKGRPTFQSMDTVGDIAISWTLGKMVLEASKEVPSLVKDARPIVDPIDDAENVAHLPIQPIRPPLSLTRESLGFSPVVAIIYFAVIFTLVFVVIPLRRQIRSFFLRTFRSSRREYGDLLEEGKMGNGNGFFHSSRPPSPTLSSKAWLYPIKRILSLGKSTPTPKLSVVTSNPMLRHTLPTPKGSPTRLFSLPNDPSPSASTTQYMHASLTRPSSPVPGYGDDNNDLSNSMNLSTMAPRRVNGINPNGKHPHQYE